MSQAGPTPVPAQPVDLTGELSADLSRALLMMLRVLRAGRHLGSGRAEPLADDCLRWLRAIVDRYGDVHLRVGVEGLFLGKERVVECAPHADPAIFRLFQHGVRQLSFHPGLGREELFGLLEVLTADLASVQNVEEDVATLLADKDFASIHFVVVETFSEGGESGGIDDRRDGDIGAIMSAALAETLSQDPELAKEKGGGTIRFWSADVKFLEGADLPALLEALPKRESERAASPLEDREIAAFAKTLEWSLDTWVDWLPSAAFSLIRRSPQGTAGTVLAILGGQLAAEAAAGRLRSMGPALAEVADWVEGRPDSEAAEAARRALSSGPLKSAAMRALAREPDSAEAALAALRWLPAEEVEATLADLGSLKPSPARNRAIGVLARRGKGAGAEAATDLLSRADGEVAQEILLATPEGPLEEATLALHQLALSHADPAVRARALWRLAHDGGDHGPSALAKGLRDDDGAVRGTALYLLATVRRAVAVALLKRWLEGKSFRKLAMDDKRTSALVLSSVAGEALVPAMRKLISKMNVTGAQRIDELRATAVAALGMLGDRESQKKLEKLAKGRLCGPALREEAQHVVGALKAGRPPYRDPLPELRRIVVDLGLAEPSAEDEEAAGPADDEPADGATRVQGAYEYVRTAPPVEPVELPPLDEAVAAEEGADGGIQIDVVFDEEGGGAPAASGDASDGVEEDVVAELLAGYSFDDMRKIEED